jgi:hypothetical protein
MTYFWFIKGIVKFTDDELKAEEITVPGEEYKKLIRKFSARSIAALSRQGFSAEEKDSEVIIKNTLYPKMFRAAKEVIDAGNANYKVNCDSFFICCDFRALKNYKRTYKDLFFALSDNNRLIAEKLYEYAAERKIMPANNTYFFRTEYKLKGKIVFITDITENNYLKINIGFAPLNSESFNAISEEIEKFNDKDEFKKFCLKHFAKYCIRCKPVCENREKPKAEIFGRKVIFCNDNIFIRINIHGFEDINLEYLKRLIDLRAAVIMKNISVPFYPGNG